MADMSVAEQTTLDSRLIDALFEVVPEDWRAFRFTVTPAEAEGAPPVLALFNPDVAEAEGTPSDDVRAIVGEIVALLGREKRSWPQLSYTGALDGNDEWRLHIVAPVPE